MAFNLKRDFNHSLYYSYGANAYDYDDYEYNNSEQIKTVKRERKKKSVKSKSVPALILLLSVVFFGSIITLYSFCLIDAKSNGIIMLQEKLKTVKSDNIMLEEEISKKFDLDITKKIAQTKLGMHEPFSYQIVHIKKPKQNYVIKYDR